VPDSVLEDSNLSTSARCVYAWLAGRVYRGKVSSVGIRRIAEKLGLNKDTVQLAITELKKRGHIRVKGGDHHRNRYEMTSNIFTPIADDDVDDTWRGFSNPSLVKKLSEKSALVSQPRKRA
jgi:DNA-binding transcriptional MocR family regulator